MNTLDYLRLPPGVRRGLNERWFDRLPPVERERLRQTAAGNGQETGRQRGDNPPEKVITRGDFLQWCTEELLRVGLAIGLLPVLFDRLPRPGAAAAGPKAPSKAPSKAPRRKAA